MFEQYTPPPPQQYEDSDSFPPKDHIGKPLIVKVLEVKAGLVTKFKPEGGEGVVCHVVDLTTGAKYRRALWMGGAVVDGLKPYVGKYLVIRFGWQAPKREGGNSYIAVEQGDAQAQQWASQYVASQGDPFPPHLDVPTGPAVAQAPAAAPWQQQAPAHTYPQAQQPPQYAAPAPQQQAPAGPPPWAQQAPAGPQGWQNTAAAAPVAAAMPQQALPPAQQYAQAAAAAPSGPPPWEQQAPAQVPAQQAAPAGAPVPPWMQQ